MESREAERRTCLEESAAHLMNGAAADPSMPAPAIVFTAVRLQTTAGRICRLLRRCLAGDLLRNTLGGMTQLERVLLARFAQLRPMPEGPRAWWDRLLDHGMATERAEEEVRELLGELDARLEEPVRLAPGPADGPGPPRAESASLRCLGLASGRAAYGIGDGADRPGD